ncbi:hypothetical protein C8T65DRAFT_653832 [Cerioporus squamosus]|nr:hypothetical protein C8T65DRAFT_653832 [Cerioporus squamosus]
MSENIRSESSAVKSASDLPPPRDRKGIRPVSPPLSNTPLHRFNYYLVLFAVLLGAFYSWRLLNWKAEVGGWWNLALGKRPPGAEALASKSNSAQRSASTLYSASSGRATGEPTVEDRITDLAAALGMPSSDLSAAIADAVREHVPPASLSSVAAHEPSGTAVRYIVDPSAAAESASSGAAGTVVSAIEAVVGLDEPPSEVGAA